MPVPFAPVLDNFNRASLGANWGARGGGTNLMQIVASVRATGTGPGTLNYAYWIPAAFGPDCECFYKLVSALVSSGDYIRLYVRIQSVATASESGYMMNWDNTAGCKILKYATRESSQTLLAINGSARFALNDQIVFRAVGTTLTVYQNGTSVVSVTDSTTAAAGNVAMGIRDGVGGLDDFGGGTIGTSLIKTILGVPRASIKTVEGVALASIATVQGISN